MLFLNSVALGCTVFMFFLICAITVAPFPINILFLSLLLPFWVTGIDMIRAIFQISFRQLQISLDRQRISLTYKLFGLESSHPLPAEEKISLSLNILKNLLSMTLRAQRQQLNLRLIFGQERTIIKQEIVITLTYPILSIISLLNRSLTSLLTN